MDRNDWTDGRLDDSKAAGKESLVRIAVACRRRACPIPSMLKEAAGFWLVGSNQVDYESCGLECGSGEADS
jgi:hypothetical protein